MVEYIVKETGYPGTLKQEIVGELVRCKDCRHFDDQELCLKNGFFVGLDLTFFCKSGERKDDD